MKCLEGMWAYFGGDDYYRWGEIKKATDEYILVEFKHCEHIPSSLSLHSLCGISDNDGILFFETEIKIQEFLDWLEIPQEDEQSDNIINLRKDN